MAMGLLYLPNCTQMHVITYTNALQLSSPLSLGLYLYMSAQTVKHKNVTSMKTSNSLVGVTISVTGSSVSGIVPGCGDFSSHYRGMCHNWLPSEGKERFSFRGDG